MKNRLFNVIFPIWILVLFPVFWLVALPANFLIDTVILLMALKLLKVSNIEKIYKSSILKIWIFGFIADIIGGVLLSATQLVPSGSEFWSRIVNSISYNPFTNIYAVLLIVLSIIISMFFIYLLNVKFTFNKTELNEKMKKKLSVILAIFTAPYLFFLPSEYLYNDGTGLVDKLNNVVVENEFSGDTITSRIFAESKNYTNTDFMYIDKISKVNSDIIESSRGSIVNMKISTNFDEDADINEYKKWAKQCSIIVFIKQKNIDEVVVNLKDLNNKEICNLPYLKSDLEAEYGVELSTLENNSVKLQEILDSINNVM